METGPVEKLDDNARELPKLVVVPDGLFADAASAQMAVVDPVSHFSPLALRPPWLYCR